MASEVIEIADGFLLWKSPSYRYRSSAPNPSTGRRMSLITLSVKRNTPVRPCRLSHDPALAGNGYSEEHRHEELQITTSPVTHESYNPTTSHPGKYELPESRATWTRNYQCFPYQT